MAGASLIFEYQWRAFWRRAVRTRRAEFYVPVVALLATMAAVVLRDHGSRAAGELAARQTASMDRLLLALCLLWLVVVNENLHVSLSSDRLRRFPLDVHSLLALRLYSLFMSPITWLAALVSLPGLSPMLSAAHPLLGMLAALCVFALAIGAGVSVSHAAGIARSRRRLLVGAASFAAVAVVFALATSVTTVAVAATPSAIAVPWAILLVSAVAVWSLVRWSFVQRLHGATSEHTARRATSIARFPGRLAPLVQKEQRALRRALKLWAGLLLVVAASAVSLSASRSSTFRQTILVIVCVLNANVTLNCLGLERPAALTRYLILPTSGRDVLVAKNIALMLAVAVQFALLLATGAWQSGVLQLVADSVVAIVLVLAHLACGNVVSVFQPYRTEPHRFGSGGDLVTVLASLLLASIPGAAVIGLLRSDLPDFPARALAIAAIVLLTMAAYVISLRYAGRNLEQRIESIRARLA
jgi:hypothetical protein